MTTPWLNIALLIVTMLAAAAAWAAWGGARQRGALVVTLLEECRAAVEAQALTAAQQAELAVLRNARLAVLGMDDVTFATQARDLLAAVPTVEEWETGKRLAAGERE